MSQNQSQNQKKQPEYNSLRIVGGLVLAVNEVDNKGYVSKKINIQFGEVRYTDKNRIDVYNAIQVQFAMPDPDKAKTDKSIEYAKKMLKIYNEISPNDVIDAEIYFRLVNWNNSSFMVCEFGNVEIVSSAPKEDAAVLDAQRKIDRANKTLAKPSVQDAIKSFGLQQNEAVVQDNSDADDLPF